MSVRPTGYLSHQTALYLHGLTPVLPDPIYANVEQQGDGRNDSILTQDAINRAFRRQPRISSNQAEFSGSNICLISGKRTGEVGVIEASHPRHGLLRYTNLERTLIDVTVRPYLVGGATEVLRAFLAAARQVSVERLYETLSELNFAYPYHQAIGFYLEQSQTLSEASLSVFRQLPRDFDFYLECDKSDMNYSSQWRIFYAKELDEVNVHSSR